MPEHESNAANKTPDAPTAAPQSPVEGVSGCLYCESAWPLDGTVHLTPNGRFPCVKGMPVPQIPDRAGTEPRLNRVSGDASLGDVEIRFGPPDAMNFSAIDEVVASDAHVHLERMNKGQWSLIIESKNQRACFMINGKDTGRSPVTTQIFCIDPVGSVSDSAGEKEKKR